MQYYKSKSEVKRHGYNIAVIQPDLMYGQVHKYLED